MLTRRGEWQTLGVKEAKRLGMERSAAVAAGIPAAIALLTAVYVAAVEPRRVRIVRFRLRVADLPAALDGVRIVHLTDFHLGMAGTRGSTLRRAVAAAVAARPDLIALTGDFVDARVWEWSGDQFAPLARAAPALAVLGKHDRLASAAATERIVAHLTGQGVRVLRHEHVAPSLRDGAAALTVVAVDHPVEGHDDLPGAMVGLSTAPESACPALLLGHAPDIVRQAPPGRFILTLAGHTHGGQIRLTPFRRRTPLDVSMAAGDLDSTYARGTHVVAANPLFVNNGLGSSGVPLRFLAPPQVAVFRLTAGLLTKATDDPARSFEAAG